MNEAVLQTHDLTRYFGSKAAVQQLNLSVPRGSVFAFLGRNGSGKTTTIRMLLGLLPATRGRAEILGYDSAKLPIEARARIGYMAEGHPLYGWMRVEEARTFQAGFYPKWNGELYKSVIEHFRIDPRNYIKNLSRGQKAGVALALTLAQEPEVLILDDPALGLDPVARRSLLEAMVFFTRRRERTVFFSSHLLPDIERVADYIAIMDQSVLRCCCTIETFRARVRRFVLLFKEQPPRQLPPVPGLLRFTRQEHELHLTVVEGSPELRNILDSMGAAGIQETPLPLEDAFLDYLGERGHRASFLQEVGGAV